MDVFLWVRWGWYAIVLVRAERVRIVGKGGRREHSVEHRVVCIGSSRVRNPLPRRLIRDSIGSLLVLHLDSRRWKPCRGIHEVLRAPYCRIENTGDHANVRLGRMRLRGRLLRKILARVARTLKAHEGISQERIREAARVIGPHRKVRWKVIVLVAVASLVVHTTVYLSKPWILCTVPHLRKRGGRVAALLPLLHGWLSIMFQLRGHGGGSIVVLCACGGRNQVVVGQLASAVSVARRGSSMVGGNAVVVWSLI